jgi:hypothetical protein
MASRTVRLDDDIETLLGEIVNQTGLSVSEVLKGGVVALHRQLQDRPQPTAWEVYEKLDLGPGGYAIAPARDAHRVVAEEIRRKHRR